MVVSMGAYGTALDPYAACLFVQSPARLSVNATTAWMELQTQVLQEEACGSLSRLVCPIMSHTLFNPDCRFHVI